jgi:hypothetical protein
MAFSVLEVIGLQQATNKSCIALKHFIQQLDALMLLKRT